MRASPDYAKYMMQTDAERATTERSHPSAVAKSFSAIQQFMADKQRVDKAMLNQQYNSSFRAPQSLESFEQGRPEYKAPSPIEQWKIRLGAMMESANPVLQEQAMKEMQSQAQEEVKPPKDPKRSNSAQIAVDLGYVPGTKAFNDFVKAHAMKAGTSVTIAAGTKPMKREDALSLVDRDGQPVMNPPVDLTPDGAAARGWTYGNKATEGEAKSDAAFEASQEMLARLTELTSAEGGANVTGIAGVLDDYRSANTLAGSAIDTLMNVLGAPMSPQNAEAHSITKNLASQLIQAMRGAQVGPLEIEQFVKQLPVAGQPPAVFEANKIVTERNLALINERMAKSRGRAGMATSTAVKPPPPVKEVPANATKEADGSITWSDKTYEYMRLPNGKIKWRTK